jgi:hypothetical protein
MPSRWSGGLGLLGGLAGSPGSGDGTRANARFFNPSGIAVDGAGTIYVADSMNNTIRVGMPLLGALPELGITSWPGEVVLSWPGAAVDFALQAAESLGPGVNWITITNGIFLEGGAFRTTNTATGHATFYRLRSQ